MNPSSVRGKNNSSTLRSLNLTMRTLKLAPDAALARLGLPCLKNMPRSFRMGLIRLNNRDTASNLPNTGSLANFEELSFSAPLNRQDLFQLRSFLKRNREFELRYSYNNGSGPSFGLTSGSGLIKSSGNTHKLLINDRSSAVRTEVPLDKIEALNIKTKLARAKL